MSSVLASRRVPSFCDVQPAKMNSEESKKQLSIGSNGVSISKWNELYSYTPRIIYSSMTKNEVFIEIPVVIHPCVDTIGYWATCEFSNGGCTVQCDTIQETQSSMLDAINFYFEDNIESSENYFVSFVIKNGEATNN